MYPITFDELKIARGVGEGKTKKYGQEFIELIDKYVKENEIEQAFTDVARYPQHRCKIRQ